MCEAKNNPSVKVEVTDGLLHLAEIGKIPENRIGSLTEIFLARASDDATKIPATKGLGLLAKNNEIPADSLAELTAALLARANDSDNATKVAATLGLGSLAILKELLSQHDDNSPMFQNFPLRFYASLNAIKPDQLNYNLLGISPSLIVFCAKTFLRSAAIGYDGTSLTFSSPYYTATSSSNMGVSTSTATDSAIPPVITFTSSSMEGISSTINQNNTSAAQTNSKRNINEVNGHVGEEQNSKRSR